MNCTSMTFTLYKQYFRSAENKISLYTFAQMGDFTNLITDQPIDEPMAREIKDSGTELVVVEE